jgi:hypothetical protein
VENVQDFSAVAPLMGVYSMGSFVLALVVIAGMWKTFAKAGKPGWAAIVPIYNIIVLLEIVGRPLWWIVLLIVPFVNFVVLIMVTNDLSKSFGHGIGMTLGLLFLPYVFYLVLGFGGSKYTGPAAAR